MRFLVLIALCLALASATYTSRNRFNRLIRALQQQQHGYGTRGLTRLDLDDIYQDDQDENDDEDDYYQQQQQCGRHQQCSLDLEDDNTEYDSDEQQDEDYYQGRHHQTHRQQQQKRQRQQRHQCQPNYRLLEQLEHANTHLASKLYKQAKHENDDKNTVISPAAVQLALAAISRGARGNTRRQLRRVTGATLTKHQDQQAHTALQQALQGQDPLHQQTGQRQHAHIKTTTTIVINQRNRAQQRFIQAVQACTNTQVKKCDFQHQPQQCRQQINRYVAQRTNHKLQHVVPQDAVTTNTKLVVVSTAQVNARWGQQFRNQQQTRSGRFYPLGSRQPKHVQVLQSQGQFNYYEDEQLQVVGVPTQQQELTLYVIVPKDKDGLNQVEKQQIQNGQQLRQLLEQAEQQQEEIDIELPKFQIKHKIDAKQTLRKEGVQDVFDADEADLSGINGQQQQQQGGRHHQQQYEDDEDQDQDRDQQQNQNQLHVNKLIHQATIKIDEQGIRAAQPRHHDQRRYQNHDQDEYQNENDEENDDENDEGYQQYHQQQWERQELLEGVFGQQQSRRQGRHHRRHRGHHENQGEKKVKVNRAFAFALKHNPSNQIVLVGRVVDATQKPRNQQQQQQHQGRHQQGQQSLNGVDQQ